MIVESVQRIQMQPTPQLTIKVSIGNVMILMNQISSQIMMHTMNRQLQRRQLFINQNQNPVALIMWHNRRVVKQKLTVVNVHVHPRAVHHRIQIRIQVQIPKRNVNVNESENTRNKRNRKNRRKRRRRKNKLLAAFYFLMLFFFIELN